LDRIISVYHPTNRPNYTEIVVGDLISVSVSYQTVVAFWGPNGRRVCQNAWSTTTGKHLNHIDGGDKQAKADRLPYNEFRRQYAAALVACGLADASQLRELAEADAPVGA